jgi:hypothetical protein
VNAAALIVLLITNQGYWFGGREGVIEVRWAIEERLPDATLMWELSFGATPISNGRVALRADQDGSQIKLTLPKVRVPTRMSWSYRIESADGKKLDEGAAPLHVFPDDLLGDAKRWQDKAIVVLGGEDGISEVLTAAKVVHRDVADASGLQFVRADMVLVGPDALKDTAGQTFLRGLAESGAGVMLFEQREAKVLFDMPTAPRPVRGPLAWRGEHPLLAGLGDEGWQSLLTGEKREPRAIRVPADEPALELAWWPAESPGEFEPIDALLLTRSLGRGRIVFCQLPLRDWKHDPRAHLMVRNALDYLATRPEPTPSAKERARQRKEKLKLSGTTP